MSCTGIGIMHNHNIRGGIDTMVLFIVPCHEREYKFQYYVTVLEYSISIASTTMDIDYIDIFNFVKTIQIHTDIDSSFMYLYHDQCDAGINNI